MYIVAIREELKRLRSHKKLIYQDGDKPLLDRTVRQMLNDDFNMESFFRMVKALGCVFLADGKLVSSTIELGQYLASKRSSKGVTQFDIVKQTALTPQRIVTIEKGKNYRYSTLIRYLSAFEDDFIDFEII